ncbi:hypothetical protein PGT21_020798 [Puccinia graminis f. sp. tritici]|uniref:Uncharacterized protein n=1 Tax=Puccinia graminis f. sp. tritici TaxID=56615 RepID=A0A5B0NGE6_PUCGR|nr:hypothetical protein PGT21_020798 [Puccinia graminis f. sp. tritici]
MIKKRTGSGRGICPADLHIHIWQTAPEPTFLSQPTMVEELARLGSFPLITMQTDIRHGIGPAVLHTLPAVHGLLHSDSDQQTGWTPLRPVSEEV